MARHVVDPSMQEVSRGITRVSAIGQRVFEAHLANIESWQKLGFDCRWQEGVMAKISATSLPFPWNNHLPFAADIKRTASFVVTDG